MALKSVEKFDPAHKKQVLTYLISLVYCGVLSLELFQVVQELRFAGQPQEVKANHLLHSFCHGAQQTA